MNYRLVIWEVSPENAYCEVGTVQGEYTVLRALGLAWEQSSDPKSDSDWTREASVEVARAYSWTSIEFWRFEDELEELITNCLGMTN